MKLCYPAPGQTHKIPLLRAPAQKSDESDADFAKRCEVQADSPLSRIYVSVRLMKQEAVIDWGHQADQIRAQAEKAALERDPKAAADQLKALLALQREVIIAACAGLEPVEVGGKNLADAGLDPKERADLLPDALLGPVYLACLRGQRPEPEQRD